MARPLPPANDELGRKIRTRLASAIEEASPERLTEIGPTEILPGTGGLGRANMAAFIRRLSRARSGLDYVYWCLDELVSELGLEDAFLVIDHPDLGPQLFARPGRAVGELAGAEELVWPGLHLRPPGLRGQDATTITSLCELALTLALAQTESPEGVLSETERVELSVRRRPGIMWARCASGGPGEALVVWAGGSPASPGLARSLADQLEAGSRRSVQVEVVDLSRPPAARAPAGPVRPGRIRLDAVEPSADRAGMVEVKLSLDGRTGRGLSESTYPDQTGTARATLGAVASLSLAPGYAVASVTRLGFGSGAPVLVVLSDQQGSDRLGVARNADPWMAAARAVLAALNREIEREIERELDPEAGREGADGYPGAPPT